MTLHRMQEQVDQIYARTMAGPGSPAHDDDMAEAIEAKSPDAEAMRATAFALREMLARLPVTSTATRADGDTRLRSPLLSTYSPPLAYHSSRPHSPAWALDHHGDADDNETAIRRRMQAYLAFAEARQKHVVAAAKSPAHKLG